MLRSEGGTSSNKIQYRILKSNTSSFMYIRLYNPMLYMIILKWSWVTDSLKYFNYIVLENIYVCISNQLCLYLCYNQHLTINESVHLNYLLCIMAVKHKYFIKKLSILIPLIWLPSTQWGNYRWLYSQQIQPDNCHTPGRYSITQYFCI